MASLGRRGLEKRSSSKQNVTLLSDSFFFVDSGLVILAVLLFISI